MTASYFLPAGAGEIAALGVVQMRVVADSAVSGGRFAVAEFRGGAGPWTVRHAHQNMEESFYVLEGAFEFAVGDATLDAQAGSFVYVPRGTAHVMTAAPGGGALLTLFSPGGLEDMFRELAKLGADALRDPAVRRQVASRFDSMPV
jgi:quercetin dioxygenase-like cupin family protein